MEKIQFDSGVRSYRLNGGILRFNPADPNVYSRFLEAVEKLQQLEKTLLAEPKEDAQGLLEAMTRADREIKQLLAWVFGSGNDFDKLLEGVNLLAVAENGQYVVSNLLAALEPVLVEGAKRCAGQQVREAVAKANARREG